MTIWLGLDPGVSLTGWALVEIDGRRPPRFLDGGHHAAELLPPQIARADRVALEWLANGLFERSRHDDLVGTARIEGGLVWMIERENKSLLKLSAGQWRADVVGRSSPSDAEIAEVVRRRVTGIRELRTAEAPHVMDAIGVAIAAACGPGEQIKLALGRGRKVG